MGNGRAVTKEAAVYTEPRGDDVGMEGRRIDDEGGGGGGGGGGVVDPADVIFPGLTHSASLVKTP